MASPGRKKKPVVVNRMKDEAKNDKKYDCSYPNHKAVVTLFNKKALCWIYAYGDLQNEYSRDRILFIERGEDIYAQSHYKEPYCVLYRRDWMNGKDIV